MADLRDHSPDGADRAEWDRLWRAMPLRVLTSPDAGFLVETSGQFGRPISFTISEDPPEFSDQVWRQSRSCPVCGNPTSEEGRAAASLHPRWANGLTLAIGVWVHRTCFENCPDSAEFAPIPW